MKRILGTIVVIAIIGAVAFFGGRALGLIPVPGAETEAGAPGSDAAATPLPPITATQGVIADARVVPVQRAGLSAAVGGIVAELLVKEGDQVTAGQPILRIDGYRRAVQRSPVPRLTSQRAQANLDDLLDGNRAEDIAAYGVTLDSAKAQLIVGPEHLVQGSDAVQASVASANANLQKRTGRADRAGAIAAKADIADAEVHPTPGPTRQRSGQVAQRMWGPPRNRPTQTANNNGEAAKALRQSRVGRPWQAEVNAGQCPDSGRPQSNSLRASVR
ncbi:MAG: biotin/lipoyl-binding protein [Caldilineaceae bacterium]